MIAETISHYRIVKKLGAGGMGEVYKAIDLTLDRPVALKILPAYLVEDPDRVRRFVQEAKSASALNHPNIVTIYEIGQAAPDCRPDESPEAARRGPETPAGDPEGKTLMLQPGAGVIHYIAMEFVDGVTLHTKVHREKADLKKVLEYMAQVGDGLAKAHAAGIVHRDLKPENIMITEDDYAKILDFGLAKLIEPRGAGPSPEDLEEAATAMMDHTRPGMVMGTIGYMSPEQVQGKVVDQRSDIFSFGCILYEAATGLKPFAGDSVIDSLHKIVYAQTPPIKESNPYAPIELQRIIKKCLAKDASQRYQSIKDVSLDLRELLKEYDSLPTVSGPFIQAATTGMHPQAAHSTGPHSHPPITAPHSQYTTGAEHALSSGEARATGPLRKRRPLLWPTLAGAVVLAAVVAAVAFYLRGASVDPRGPAFEDTRITRLTSTGRSLGASISPDGKYVAYVINEAGQQSLWVRQVATSSNVQIVAPAEVSYLGTTFSNDGNFVYYVRGERGNPIRTLYQVPVLGGSPRKVLEDVDSPITFSPNGKQFAFLRGYVRESELALMVANADGTGEQKLSVRKQPNIYMRAAWSPDGKVIACAAQNLVGGMHHQVVAVNVADGSEEVIGSHRWAVLGGLAWLSDGSGLILSAVDRAAGSSQFQLYELSYPTGRFRRVTNDLGNYTGVSMPSNSSSIVTVQADAVSNIWVAPNGDASRATQLTSGSGKYDQVTWAPDGTLVYVTDAGGNADIWAMDPSGKNQKQLTADAGINVYCSPTPDGRYVVFNSNRAGGASVFNVWRMNADGSDPRQLTSGEGEFWPVGSPDGKWVLYTSLTSSDKPTIWKVPVDGGEPARLTDRFTMQPVISPDGKTILCRYFDEQSVSLPKLALFSFDTGQLIKVLDTSPTNYQPGQYRWAADGKSILYSNTQGGVSNIWSQPIDGGAPRQVTSFKSDLIFGFDWSRDGKQLACARGITTTDVILIKDLARAEEK